MEKVRTLVALLAFTSVVAACDGPRTTTDAGAEDGGADPCEGRTTCASAGTSCSGDSLVTCAADADGCLVETTTDCGLTDQVCDDSGATAACVDPCASIPATDRCDTDGARACAEDTLEVCTTNADGCLVLERTDCAAASGGACDESGTMPMCVLPTDPCADVTNACTTEGTSCSGDSLVTCAPNAFGCLVETTVDCSSRASGTCDDSGSAAACTFTGDPCDGVTECTTAGTTCEGPDLVECAEDAFGCMVETRTTCTDTMFGFCDADGTPPACSTAATDPCMGVTECGTEAASSCTDTTTLAVCAPNAFGCFVSSDTDCSATSEVCSDASGTAACVDPCSLVTTCASTLSCDGADLVTCAPDTNGCLVESDRTTCEISCDSSGTPACLTAAPNAMCSAATAVTADVTITGENTALGGTRPADVSCGTDGYTDETLYYAVTVPARQIADVALTYGTATDLLLFAQAACTDTECLGAVDYVSPTAEAASIPNPTDAPITVVVGVAPYHSGDGGTYDIAVTYRTYATNAFCSGATAVTADTTITGEDTTIGGPRPTGSGCGTGGETNATLYYAVTVPAGQEVDVQLTYGTATDLLLFVQNACTDTDCAFGTDLFPPDEEVLTLTNPGTSSITAVVGVGAYDAGDGGTYDIAFTYRTPTVAANATCAGATAVSATTSIAGEDTGGGGARPTGTGCGGGSETGETLYYSVTVPAGEVVDVALTYGTATDLVLFAQSSCATADCAGLSDLFPPDEESFSIPNTGSAPITVVVGVRPYDAGDGGTYDIAFTYSTLTGGDTCGAATAITASGTFTSTTGAFTDDYDLPSSGCTGFGTPGPDVAYAVTLAAGQTLDATVTPAGSFDAALYVLTDCSMTASCVDGSDGGFSGDPETISYTATSAGTVYLIVDSYDSAEVGSYSLSVTLTP